MYETCNKFLELAMFLTSQVVRALEGMSSVPFLEVRIHSLVRLNRIIVIMLFRLRMPIDNAINAYLYLSQYVFSNPRTWPRRDGILFEASRLEDALIKIIQTTSGIGDQARGLRMLDDQGPKWLVALVNSRPTLIPN